MALRFPTQTLVVAVVVGLGLLRIGFGGPPDVAIDVASAKHLSVCLRESREIPATTPVSLVPLPPVDAARAGFHVVNAVDFVATGAVRLDLAPDEAQVDEHGKVLSGERWFVIGNPAGPFEFELSPLETGALGSEAVELHRGGARFLLRVKQPLRFGPASNLSYKVKLTDAKVAKGDRGPVLVAGQKGKLDLGAGQTFVALQPISPMFWPAGTQPTLAPIRGFGQGGQADLTIEARQPGLAFGDPAFGVRACVRVGGRGKGADARNGDAGRTPSGATDNCNCRPADGGSPGVDWRAVGVVDLKAHDGGGTVRVSMPSDIISPFAWMIPVDLAVASLDGQYMAYGGITVIGKLLSALIATVFALGLFAWLATLPDPGSNGVFRGLVSRVSSNQADGTDRPRRRALWFSSLFTGPDMDPSLSLFQIFFWTVITVWGLAYVFVVTGSLLTMTQSMMWLLGIAGTGSVVARFIAAPSGSTSSGPSAQAAAPRLAARGRRELVDLSSMLSTRGNFDLLKLQLFVFTLSIGAYVVWRIADSGAFPELDTNTLLLLGVSQGVYIGGKLAGTTALARSQELKAKLDIAAEERKNIPGESASLDAELGTLTQKPAATRTPAENSRIDAINKAKQLDAQIKQLEADYVAALKELGLKPA